MTPILQLMHDTVSKLGTIKLSAELLKRGGLSVADQEKISDGMIEKVNELNSVLDNHYKETKDKDLVIKNLIQSLKDISESIQFSDNVMLKSIRIEAEDAIKNATL